MAGTGEGGHRYCPNCKRIRETRVMPGGYSQVRFRGLPAKRREVICGTDAQGSNGCGTKWFTLEIEENSLNSLP